jgi:hypothetical protein
MTISTKSSHCSPGIIEKSAIDGQKVYHGDLEREARVYIKEHQSEFVPAGMEVAETLANEKAECDAVAAEGVSSDATGSNNTEDQAKQRERDRNRRSLQWAWDTFSGAYDVASQSTKGAIELIKDAWDQSSSTTILYFIIVILVFSNLWTLMRVNTREDVIKAKLLRKEEERDRLVQGVVLKLRDELGMVKAGSYVPPVPPIHQQQPVNGNGQFNWREEVAHIEATLEAVEARLKSMKEGLAEIKAQTLDTVD